MQNRHFTKHAWSGLDEYLLMQLFPLGDNFDIYINLLFA